MHVIQAEEYAKINNEKELEKKQKNIRRMFFFFRNIYF